MIVVKDLMNKLDIEEKIAEEAKRKEDGGEGTSGSNKTRSDNNSCATIDRITRFIRSNKFDGSYAKWNEWKSSYEGLVHNTNISVIEKFHTLKQSLVGDAASIISGWQVVAENYESALSIE